MAMLDYARALNSAQYEAATSEAPAILVVAGAGSGKTRVITHRLAWLVEHGAAPGSILLLTFTRKAAHEMMARAGNLLSQGLHGLLGGTFHSFAYGALRRFRPAWLEGRNFSLMDSTDITMAVNHCREAVKAGKKDQSFPKTRAVADIISKARNKELTIEEVLRRDSFHLLPHAENLEKISQAYAAYKKEKGLLDYDDLLFELEALLSARNFAAEEMRNRFSHILVDEYQDTNLVQARITRLLAGPLPEPGEKPALCAKVMAVGDEAQSIYAFRGANVRNILDFPKFFPDAAIIRLEENYRSTQPILDVANSILDHAAESYRKKLFTKKEGGEKAGLVIPLSDGSEAGLVLRRIEDLLADHRPHEIAVLFRSGYHSYPLENALRKAGIAFRKYGGLKFLEAAHIKDIVSFARLAANPLDQPAFSRIAAMHKGIGPKTSERLYNVFSRSGPEALRKALAKYPDLRGDVEFIEELKERELAPAEFFEALLDYYRPRLESLYPEDWPSRLQGLAEMPRMAESYADLDLFLADLALEPPEEEKEGNAENCVTLSTIHSAKGLEWNAVIILDMVEDRFPSRHSLAHEEDYEEERRLFYVACTRARQTLDIYAPRTIYKKAAFGNEAVAQSPFLREIPSGLLSLSQERMDGGLRQDSGRVPRAISSIPDLDGRLSKTFMRASPESEAKGGISRDALVCRHKIFGRGKVVEWLDSNKVRVDFAAFGLKTILAEYLLPEE